MVENPGCEGVTPDPWMLDRHGGSGNLIQAAARRQGSWGLRLGVDNSAWDEARQVVSVICPQWSGVPAGSRVVAEFSYWVQATHTGPVTNGDVLNVVLLTEDGRQLLQLLDTVTDAHADGQWRRSQFDINDQIGDTIQVAISVTTDETGPTIFDVDDVALTIRLEREIYEQYLPLLARLPH
jgi:hypothetical protein